MRLAGLGGGCSHTGGPTYVNSSPKTAGTTTMLNPCLPPGLTLITRNVRRPDDGSMCDLVRSQRGVFGTMIAGVWRSISPADAQRIMRDAETDTADAHD